MSSKANKVRWEDIDCIKFRATLGLDSTTCQNHTIRIWHEYSLALIGFRTKMYKKYKGFKLVWLALKQNEPSHVPIILEPFTVIHLTRAITLVLTKQNAIWNWFILHVVYLSVVWNRFLHFVNLSRHLIPDGIHYHKGMREEASTAILFSCTRHGNLLLPFLCPWIGWGLNLLYPNRSTASALPNVVCS